MSVVKRLARIFSTLLLVLVLLVCAAVLGTQTTWFKNWLRGYIEREAHEHLNGQLFIGHLGGSLFYGVELENVALSMNGRRMVSAKDIELRYNALTLVTRGLDIDSLRIDEPVLHLARQDDTWSIARLVKSNQQASNQHESTLSISVDRIDVSNGSLVFDDALVVPGVPGVIVPRRIDHVDARLGFTFAPASYGVEITHASFRASEPSFALNELTGRVAARQDGIHVDKLVLRTGHSSFVADGVLQHYSTNPSVTLHATADTVSLQEFSAVVPALAAIEVEPQLDVTLDGPLDHLSASIDVRSSAGDVNGHFVAGILPSSQSVRGTVSARHLNAAPFMNDPAFESDITATMTADVHGAALSNPASLDGSIVIQSPRIILSGYAV
jgi:autotransporter translocation and assembly factor TamB